MLVDITPFYQPKILNILQGTRNGKEGSQLLLLMLPGIFSNKDFPVEDL